MFLTWAQLDVERLGFPISAPHPPERQQHVDAAPAARRLSTAQLVLAAALLPFHSSLFFTRRRFVGAGEEFLLPSPPFLAGPQAPELSAVSSIFRAELQQMK